MVLGRDLKGTPAEEHTELVAGWMFLLLCAWGWVCGWSGVLACVLGSG